MNEQPDAKPVAWRWRLKGDPDWSFWEDRGPWPDDVEVEPLYTAPPNPDASGLVGAAEWLMERAHLIGGMSARSYREAASALRFRAANARGLQTKIEAAEWPYGYQDTFNLISDATGLVGGHIGISVSKFLKAYNKLRARAADRDSSAGLIEAAEWRIISEALRIAREDGSIDNFATDAEYEALKEKVRSRAADRSGK